MILPILHAIQVGVAVFLGVAVLLIPDMNLMGQTHVISIPRGAELAGEMVDVFEDKMMNEFVINLT